MQRVFGWVWGRGGVATAIVAVILLVAEGSRAGGLTGVRIEGCLALSPVLALFANGVWSGRTQPAVPRFAKAASTSGSRQLRDDTNARVWFDHGGFLFRRRDWFVGTGCPPTPLTSEFLSTLATRAAVEPVCVAQRKARRYWLYGDKFVWENQGLSARDVMAMLHDRERRQARTLERAHVLLKVEQGERVPLPRQREPIPREVRQAVFARDGGRCVDCRSNFELQYDHVIPWSLGGADSVENLQLLCAPCNRAKADSL